MRVTVTYRYRYVQIDIGRYLQVSLGTRKAPLGTIQVPVGKTTYTKILVGIATSR